jgi:hypothetical protein
MNEIATQTVKNFQRHFIVWGLVLSAFFFIPHFADKPSISRPTAVGSYADVLSKNVCEDTVEGEFPTAAILREVGGGYLFTTNPVKIGKGLDEEFAGKVWKKYTAIRFCK